MENQIRLYHDLTSFWLDEGKKLRGELAQLKAKCQQLQDENQAIGCQYTQLKDKYNNLKKSLAVQSEEVNTLTCKLAEERLALDKLIKNALDSASAAEVQTVIDRLYALWDTKIRQEVKRRVAEDMPWLSGQR